MYITQPTLSELEILGFKPKTKISIEKRLFGDLLLEIGLEQAKYDKEKWTFRFIFVQHMGISQENEAWIYPSNIYRRKAHLDGYYRVTTNSGSHKAIEIDILFFAKSIANANNPAKLLSWLDHLQNLRRRESILQKIDAWWMSRGGTETDLSIFKKGEITGNNKEIALLKKMLTDFGTKS